MSRPPHPGTIVYVDERGEQRRPVNEVPESLRYGEVEGGKWLPVVRVVATTAGDQRVIREYGPGGELLRSTVQSGSVA
jgi:hypothetical protein